MLEARLDHASVLKRLLDAIKELVTDANFDCKDEGITLQAMDNSHVALVSVHLQQAGFDNYRCDRPMPLGVNLGSLTKVLKCAKDDDKVTLRASDNGDVLNLIYEAKNSDRIAEYDMKLMDIDQDSLGIPDTEYDAKVTMSSAEFSRICRDLMQLGESVRIEVTKEGVRFSSEGESANANILLKQTEGARRRYAGYGVSEEDQNKREEEDEAEGSKNKKGKSKKAAVKQEEGEDAEMEENGEEDVEEDDGGAVSDNEDGEAEPASEDEEEDEDSSSKKRKRSSGSKGKTGSSKKTKKSGEEGDAGGVLIEMNQSVNLTFSLKYLVNFAKSSSLTDKVKLQMTNEVPLQVGYYFEQGHILYYLAPKIGDD